MLAVTPFPWQADAPAIAAWHDKTATEIARYVVDDVHSRHPGFEYDADSVAASIRALMDDHSSKTPLELYELANYLRPGGSHDDAQLIMIARQVLPFASPELTVATIYQTWKGGKLGFQFLPDPAKVSLEEYESEADDLLEVLHSVDPERILVDQKYDSLPDSHDLDRSFFDSLPDRFTIYRGCNGVTPEQCAAGVCWTTKRDVAEWFAQRGSREPVVVTARARKDWVRLAFASEHEVVMRAWRGARPLKVRPVKGRPPMKWGETEMQAAA